VIQINANVSGFDPSRDAAPSLMNDSGRLAAWLFDPNSLTRGHWELPDHAPANGWTLRWADHMLRVWLSLDETHQPLPPGAYELALLHGDASQPMPSVLAYQPAVLPAIAMSGLDFVVNGSRWLLNGQDHFLGVLDCVEGREPQTYPDGNTYRTFLTLKYIPGQVGRQPLDPDAIGRTRYWDAVRGFYERATAEAKYVLWTLGDLHDLGKDEGWLQGFLAEFASVAGDWPGLFGGTNEPWNGVNGPRCPRPAIRMPYSPGSITDAGGGDGYEGPGMAGDFCAVHPRRDAAPEYKMLTHCNLAAPRRQYGKALIIDEGFKAGTVVLDGKQYNDPDFFRSQGAAYRATNGGIFHSFNGVYSQPLDGTEQACAAAFFGG
jgi:hypothetical protein